MYNLDIYPIQIHQGSIETKLPGLIALTPPRKCARGRETDQLIALIQLTGKTPITPQALSTWLEKKAALFYNSPGSVTNAMRLMAEAINNELLERNLKKAFEGLQVNGSLCLIVIRKNIMYTLIVGQAHVFIMNKTDVRELVDRENHARGLGVNQSLTCNFTQSSIAVKDSILISPVPSPLWSEDYLRGSSELSVSAFGRRLLNQHPAELSLALVRVSEGNGQVNISTINANGNIAEGEMDAIKSEGQPEMEPVNPQSVLASQPDSEPQKEEIPVTLPGFGPVEVGIISKVNRLDLAVQKPEMRMRVERRRSNKGKSLVTGSRDQVIPDKKDIKLSKKTSKKTPAVMGTHRKVENPNDEPPAVPRYLYLLLAIAIPLVVVAIAATVYIRQGKSQQFTYYYGKGQEYVAQANAHVDDPVIYSFNLQAALMYLDKAAQYGATTDAIKLHASVQTELDKIKGVVRLNLLPLNIVGGLGDVKISQIVATNTDLYLLDDNSGRVQHYNLSGTEYVNDAAFDCGPNPANPQNKIGKLVDLIQLPVGNSFAATIFAIDAYGNTEFCIPGDTGIVSTLIAPDAGWKGITAISLYQNYLYVLDPGNNAVFIYPGNGVLFEEKPTLFFDDVIPNMEKAVDIEVYADELYILRSNGEMVECTYSHMKDYKLTECEDPAPYKDMRPGQTTQTISFPDSQFIQMRMTDAPDSSLYLLDANGNGIYHFSLQRNLQKIFQPGFLDAEYAPKRAVTSLAISPGKVLFMAFGSQVYSSALP